LLIGIFKKIRQHHLILSSARHPHLASPPFSGIPAESCILFELRNPQVATTALQLEDISNMAPSLSSDVVLPGDPIPESSFPTPKKTTKPLTIGPGLQHSQGAISATVAGTLTADHKKNALWIESNGGRVGQVSVLMIGLL
jgi:hypothetical protein